MKQYELIYIPYYEDDIEQCSALCPFHKRIDIDRVKCIEFSMYLYKVIVFDKHKIYDILPIRRPHRYIYTRVPECYKYTKEQFEKKYKKKQKESIFSRIKKRIFRI